MVWLCNTLIIFNFFSLWKVNLSFSIPQKSNLFYLDFFFFLLFILWLKITQYYFNWVKNFLYCNIVIYNLNAFSFTCMDFTNKYPMKSLFVFAVNKIVVWVAVGGKDFPISLSWLLVAEIDMRQIIRSKETHLID